MSTVNLLPQDYVQRRSQQRANGMCMALFGMVALAVGGAALVSERATRNTRGVCERINASYADAARLIDEVHQLEAQKRTMLDKAKMSAALMERLPRSYVLAMLTNCLPEGSSLITLKMEVKVVNGDSQAAAGAVRTKHGVVSQARRSRSPAAAPTLSVQMNIKGKASTDVQVARFIARLAQHPLTEMVDLSYSKQAEGKETGREFQLTVRLKPNADALDAIGRLEDQHAAAPQAPARAHPTAGDGV